MPYSLRAHSILVAALVVILHVAPLYAEDEPIPSDLIATSDIAIRLPPVIEISVPIEEIMHVDSDAAFQVAFMQPEPEELSDLNEFKPQLDDSAPLSGESQPLETQPIQPRTQATDRCYEQGARSLRCGWPISAIDTLICSNSANQDIKYSKSLVVGAAFGQLDLLAEARCYYCDVARNSNNPELRRNAREYLCELDRYINSREVWRGALEVTTLYDTDPGILPLFNAVGIPQHAHTSVGNSYDLVVEHDLARDDDYDLAAGFGSYGTENYSAHDFDIGKYGAYLRYRERGYWRSTPTYAGLLVNYDYTTVGDESFLSSPAISPYVTFLHDDRTSTVLYADYRDYDFLGQGANVGTPLDIDSTYGRFGITRRRRLGSSRNVLVAAGYNYALNDSLGSDYDYQSHNLVGYILWEVPRSKALLRLGAEYFIRDYDNVNSIAGITRFDRELVVAGSILYPLLDDFFLTFDAFVDNNDSNLSFNQYDRVQVNVGLEYRFPMSWAKRSREFDRF